MDIVEPPKHRPVIAQLVLSHGAGAGSQSDFMQSVANGLSDMGVRTWLFDFPYMQMMYQSGKRRPPDRADKLKAALSEVVAQIRMSAEFDKDTPFLLGGKSMGGRIVTLLVAEEGNGQANWLADASVDGVIVLGYPFRAPGKKEIRNAHFVDIQAPTLIIQGERDTFGDKALLSTLQFPENVQTTLLADGDHSFKPRKMSGSTQQDNIETALVAIEDWIAQSVRKNR